MPAVAAILAGLVGLAAAARHRRRAECLGALGIGLAFIPFALVHEPIGAPVLGLLAGPSATLWLGRWAVRSSFAIGLAGGFLVADAIWLAARATGSTSVALIDDGRFVATMLALAAVAALGAGLTPRALSRRAATLRTMDVAAIALLAAVGAIVGFVIGPPAWVMALGTLIALLGYGSVRTLIGHWIDRVLFAEERERIAIASAESERARLSRELHDDPLQALAGVILSLEHQPDTAAEREALRTVASQLRGIATALHPPVLDDLGLVPAIESMLAESGPVAISLELDNRTGYRRAERAPFEVELATYRIVQEATTNALRHSGCQRIVVRGRVSPDAVAIEVADDGHGYADNQAEAALRAGHHGLASMRRRAESIDADLVRVGGPNAGTTVRLRWTR